MEEHLNRGIKEVMMEFPAIEKILDEYGIGCGPCAVGTCLLKDIVKIHDLSEEDEKGLMARLAQAIDPGLGVEPPPRDRKRETEKNISYSPPIKKLVDEHLLIKKWIALIPAFVKNLDVESAEGRRLILEGVDFIRSYADKRHHAKEEEILFTYFDENLEMIKVMREDHRRGRNHVKAILEALERRDKAAIAEHLNGYRELLTEHIRKEDEIMLPWMDRQMSKPQVAELSARFNGADAQMGSASPKYAAFIETLEKRYAPAEGEDGSA
ncbi:MAG: hemerythrin domain-containing protein [Thermodesulfobacteriota bacterium]